MDYKVLKDFNTTQRRLKAGPGPGGTINDQEVFEPFTIADLLDRKFLEPIEEEPQAAAPAEVKTTIATDAVASAVQPAEGEAPAKPSRVK